MHLRGKKDLYRRWNNGDTGSDGVSRNGEEHLTLENYNYYEADEEDEQEDDEDDDEGNTDYSSNYNSKQRIISGESVNGRTSNINPASSTTTAMSATGSHNNNHNHSTTTTFLNHKITKTLHHHHAVCNGFRSRGWLRAASIKMQLVGLSCGLLITGFLSGYIFGRLRGNNSNVDIATTTSKLNSSSADPLSFSHWPDTPQFHGSMLADEMNHEESSSFYPHELNETMFHRLINQISVNNIHHNLKRMTQEVHTAGTAEGRSMSMALRDLWRSFGLSVRVEQHKTLLTRSTTFNYLEVFDSNGSLLFTTSQTGDDVNLPNSVPILAFSPSIPELNGTLIFGHYGRIEDFRRLSKSDQISLNGSIILVKFSNLHPTEIVSRAMKYGVSALVFYPDIIDFGPLLPGIAVKRDSLLTMAQLHDHQKRKKKVTLPCHTISYNDAERLLSLMRNEERQAKAEVMTPLGAFSQQKLVTETDEAPRRNNNNNSKRRKGRNKNTRNPNLVMPRSSSLETKKTEGTKGLSNGDGSYSDRDEGVVRILPLHNTRLHIFNEAKSSNIYNVVASIPGTWESDRYIVIGCSHDSWAYGAGDPGIGLAIMTEIVRVFSLSVQQGWKPRRSILFISFDANLYASNGLFHWLQEHHFEISTRAITFIDLTRILEGNQTLHIYSSPLLKEFIQKTIAKIKHYEVEEATTKSNSRKKGTQTPTQWKSWLDKQNHIYSSTLSSNEPAFAFFGNLGIPFIRLSLTNSPKSYDYPLYHTAFDTYENFVNLVDSTTWSGSSETLGRIISGLILLLTDSSLLPMNVEDYVEQIQKAFENFMVYYQEDLHRANLSIAYLQAAVMRLQVIGDNFRTDVHNRSVINNEQYEIRQESQSHSATYFSNKLLFHRIINDKMMEIERAFLSKRSEFYKHQVIGYSSCSWLPLRKTHYENHIKLINKTEQPSRIGHLNSDNCNDDYFDPLDNYFPRLRESLNCGRKLRYIKESEYQAEDSIGEMNVQEECQDFRSQAAQEITMLIHCFDAAAATLQSPLLPEESDTNNNS